MKKSKKKLYNGRDYLIQKIIKGATKAGIHKDRKKEANKRASRSKVEEEEDLCWQCSFPYVREHAKNEDDKAAMDCGYCSVSCMDYHSTEE